MGGGTTRNIYSSLRKYNKLYIVASCWTIIDIKYYHFQEDKEEGRWSKTIMLCSDRYSLYYYRGKYRLEGPQACPLVLLAKVGWR